MHIRDKSSQASSCKDLHAFTSANDLMLPGMQNEDQAHVRESGDGVSGTQGLLPAPGRVHSMCLARQDAQAPAERDPLGHRLASGIPGELPQQEGPVYQPGSLLLVTEALEPCRYSNRSAFEGTACNASMFC